MSPDASAPAVPLLAQSSLQLTPCLSLPFAMLFGEADGGELPESLFSLRPYRNQCAGQRAFSALGPLAQ